MQRIAPLLLLGCLLSGGCSLGGFRLGFPGVYRIDIPQGNIVTREMIDKLQPGMTKRQVRFVMGTPLVQDTFEPERWDYVHSLQQGNGRRAEERVSLFFEGDTLSRIDADLNPEPSRDAASN